MDRTTPEGNNYVPGKGHPGESQPESEQAAMFVPLLECVGGNSEFNNADKEQVDRDTKYEMYRNNAVRYVWSEYMTPMTGGKLD